MKITTAHLAKSYLDVVEGKKEVEVLSISKNFVKLLKKRGLIKGKRAILEAIESMRDTEQSHRSVKVTSASKLSAEDIKKIEDRVKEMYSVKNITLTNTVDESLLGGVDMQIGWVKITNSLKNRIETLKKAA